MSDDTISGAFVQEQAASLQEYEHDPERAQELAAELTMLRRSVLAAAAHIQIGDEPSRYNSTLETFLHPERTKR